MIEKDWCSCFHPKDSFSFSLWVVAVKEVQFPLIVFTLIKVVEVEGKIPEPDNITHSGVPRLEVHEQYR